MPDMQEKRWSSHLSFILAATGAAVGLGSIWKFPYMVGINGGGAFVLVFLLALILIAIPIMIGEILLGKIARKNPISTMRDLAIQHNKSPNWKLVGILGAIGLLLILAFYSVIAGWSIAYMIKTWSGSLTGMNQAQINLTWDNFLARPIELILWHSIFMIMTLVIVARGVNNGIEQASKIMMPGLLIVLLILLCYSFIFGDMPAAIEFLFYPDFSKLTPAVMLSALGQAAFSLATGAGCMLVYGCYIKEKSNICYNVSIISVLIVIVSLFSGLAIFPLVFAYDLSPDSGPGLMFQVLPLAFNQMPYGNSFGGLFFLMLWFAAWTSSISMAEPLVVILIENYNYSRKKSAIIIGVICWILGLFALFSFNIYSDIKILGQYTIFDSISNIATDLILPIGALSFAIFSGWILDKKLAFESLNIQSKLLFNIWHFLTRYIAPIGIILIFMI